jgi:hypothetical protein
MEILDFFPRYISYFNLRITLLSQIGLNLRLCVIGPDLIPLVPTDIQEQWLFQTRGVLGGEGV